MGNGKSFGVGRAGPPTRIRTPSTSGRPRAGHPAEGLSDEDSAEPAYPGSLPFHACAGLGRPRKDNVGALRDEPFSDYEVGHSGMRRTLQELLLLSDHTSCWPARRRSTGDHGGTDASPRHVRFREVFTAPQSPRFAVPSQEHRPRPQISPARDRNRRCILWYIEPKALRCLSHSRAETRRWGLASPFPSGEKGPRPSARSFLLLPDHCTGGLPLRSCTAPRYLRIRGEKPALGRPFHRTPHHFHTLSGLLISLRQEGGGVSSPA